MIKLWENDLKNLKEHVSLTDYIVAAYTGETLIIDVEQEEGRLYFSSSASVKEVYALFADEIHDRAPIGEILHDEAECLDYGTGFYDHMMSNQVERAITHAIEDVHEKYHEVIQRHPKERLSVLVELAPQHFNEKNLKNLGKHKSLEGFVKETFHGRDYIGGAKEEDGISLSGAEELIFKLFPKEILQLSGRKNLTAKEVKQGRSVVSNAVTTLVQRLYEENKEEILNNPGATLKPREATHTAERN